MAPGTEFFVVAVIVVGAIFLQIAVFAHRYIRVPPDKAMVVYGARRGDAAYTVVGPGGGRFIVPIRETYLFLSLELRTVPFVGRGVASTAGVPLTIDAVAQVRISSDRDKIGAAAQQWSAKDMSEVDVAAANVLLGHLRHVCATMEVVQIATDREALAMKVRSAASADLGLIGLEVVGVIVQHVERETGLPSAVAWTGAPEVRRGAMVPAATSGEAAASARAQRVSALLDQLGSLSDEELERLAAHLEAIAKDEA